MASAPGALEPRLSSRGSRVGRRALSHCTGFVRRQPTGSIAFCDLLCILKVQQLTDSYLACSSCSMEGRIEWCILIVARYTWNIPSPLPPPPTNAQKNTQEKKSLLTVSYRFQVIAKSKPLIAEQNTVLLGKIRFCIIANRWKSLHAIKFKAAQ